MTVSEYHDQEPEIVLQELEERTTPEEIQWLFSGLALTWARTPGRFRDGEHHGHYSSLLRLSNLAFMQPNIKIDLFIAASDERRGECRS